MTDTYFSLASANFEQFWTATGQIAADDDWSGVASIVGYRGDGLTASTPGDPRTVSGTSTVIDVNANRADPSTFSTGGVAEFDGIPDPVVAIQGSGTARAPYLAVFLDATGRENITFSTRLRDIDTASSASQPIAIQYRIGTGAWTAVDGGYTANANTGGDTSLSVTLPAAANNAARLEVRVITLDVTGSDAFIGIDDIRVTSSAIVVAQPGILSVADAAIDEGNDGTSLLAFTVSRDGGTAGAVSASYTLSLPGGSGGADAADLAAGTPLTGTVSFADGETSKVIEIAVRGDTAFEPTETFGLTLSAPTGGATLGDAAAIGTIRNDDAAPPAPPAAFINELHYDNSGADANEAVEIAGIAGTSLNGWRLVFYNGGNGQSYGTVNLAGTIPDQDDGYGTLSFAFAGIQNGAPDGVALVDGGGRVVQFLSYEGSFTAANGPAQGLVSTDIGVAEEPVPGAGFSLQLTGTGAVYEDFVWAEARDDSFGAVNAGQDFIAADADGLVSIRDARVAEGNDGTSDLVFTVRRAGGTAGTASVDYQVSFGTADAADLGDGAVLSGTVTFGPGESGKTIVVPVRGDTVGELNETLNVVLSNPVGPITIADGSATGTIVNDDRLSLTIPEIQGAGHRSAFEGQPVATSGVVTAVDGNGFYLQDAAGDGDVATSDAVFVLTGNRPTVVVGDAVQVEAVVAEFLPGGDPANLTVTQLTATSILRTGSGEVPEAVLIGQGGRLPPTETIDDDGFASFDPATDGIDFYESLEGMRVTVDAPVAVSNTTGFGETYVLASGGEGATGQAARGGVTVSPGDFNPERIQIDADSDLNAGYQPAHTIGDRLSDVTGIVSYSFNSYEVLVTGDVAVTTDVTLGREVTSLAPAADRLNIATFNVENLDLTDSQQKFDLLAGNIVTNLAAPDIIGVQEIQDADGAGGGANLSGQATAQKLIDAIKAAGGPDYLYVEVAPSAPGQTGGEPGGNIRNGFLYNPDRVAYIAGSAELIADPVFNGTRRPLVADFLFNNQQVTAINVHSTSRIGSDPLFGATQPPADAGDAARTQQAQAVRAYVNNQLATNAALQFTVLGDFNGFYFEDAIGALEAGGLFTDLHRLLPEEERYSFLFDGNLQALDHILVTGGLLNGALYDAVHINAEQSEGTARATDHDPQLASLAIAAGQAPRGTAGNDVIGGTSGTDAIRGGFGDDQLYGLGGADSLYGDAGDDRIEGGSGDDRLEGNDGNDVILAGSGNDGVNGGNGDDVVDGGAGDDRLSGFDGIDRITAGDGNDQVDGGAGDDVLDGGAGDDKIVGRDGDDVITGGLGFDDMTGGEGGDLFVFVDVAESTVTRSDYIRGFAVGDSIDLGAIDADISTAADDAFTLVDRFSGTAGELVANRLIGANYQVMGDVDGDGRADFRVVLIGSIAPEAGDFIL